MAAQPNPWGTIASRESAATGRVRPRHETNVPEWQRYRQSPLTEKQPSDLSADLFSDVLAESRFNAEAEIVGEKRAAEAAENDSLPRILVAIDKLMSPNEDDGDPAATEHAYRSARAVVESAYGRLLASKEPQVKRLPLPLATTDERGGVRLAWQFGDRHVRTSFGAAENLRSYLYFESPMEHDAEALQPSVLSARLDWMLRA